MMVSPPRDFLHCFGSASAVNYRLQLCVATGLLLLRLGCSSFSPPRLIFDTGISLGLFPCRSCCLILAFSLFVLRFMCLCFQLLSRLLNFLFILKKHLSSGDEVWFDVTATHSTCHSKLPKELRLTKLRKTAGKTGNRMKSAAVLDAHTKKRDKYALLEAIVERQLISEWSAIGCTAHPPSCHLDTR